MPSVPYDSYILHAYPGPLGGVHWHVVGKYIEALVKPPANLSAASLYVTASDIGLKNADFAQMRHLLNQWMYYNGLEDPKAEFHSFGYTTTKTDLEAMTKVIHEAVKRHITL